MPRQYDVTVMETHTQFLHALVKGKARGIQFLVTVVYGLNRSTERKVLWTKLQQLAVSVVLPWLCGGDFNNILHPVEKVGVQRVQLPDIVDFQQCVELCCLVDMKWQGKQFTWTNKQQIETRVCSKLRGYSSMKNG